MIGYAALAEGYARPGLAHADAFSLAKDGPFGLRAFHRTLPGITVLKFRPVLDLFDPIVVKQ